MDEGLRDDDEAIIEARGPSQTDVTQSEMHIRSHFLRQKATIKNAGGSIIQFLTNNEDGHTQCIGIMRLPSMRIDELLDFIADCQGHIKASAINAWKGHVSRTNNPVGYNENLPHEDFGMSMTLRVTSGGRLGPNDGEVFIGALDFPHLVQPLDLTAAWEQENPSQPSFGYWFNCRIILNEASKRRSLVKAAHAVSQLKEAPPNGKIGTHVIENTEYPDKQGWSQQQGPHKRRADYPSTRRKEPRTPEYPKKLRSDRPQSRGEVDRPRHHRDEPDRREPVRQKTPVPADFAQALPTRGRLPEWNKSSEPPAFDYESWKVIDNDRRKKQSVSLVQH